MIADNLDHVIKAAKLAKLLLKLPAGSEVQCNQVGNLAILKNGRQIGHIELGEPEEVVIYPHEGSSNISHWRGEVIKDGKVVGHYEYEGTVDVALNPIWPSQEEMHEHWREGIRRSCTCGNPPSNVILWAAYGNGFYWPAKACLSCQVITDGLAPDFETLGEGYPL